MKRTAPSAEKNREPILETLRPMLQPGTRVLEVASGTGQHAVHFARNLPEVEWQPTEHSQEALASIEAWRRESALPNLRSPLPLDVTSSTWPVQSADVVFCSNMIHIAPWAAALGLLAGAERVLGQGGLLVLYGPFLQAGVTTAPSNLAFDATLRAQNPEWGVRSLEELAAAAARHGLALHRTVAMPSNNLTVVFRRT